MRKVFMLFLFLPIILYGQEKDKEIITFYADQEAYILTANTNRDDTSFHLELAKNGKVINEKIIPLTGRCPIEKDIHIESFDNGFTIRIPYCEGYLFRLGKARFVYSNKHDDFVLAAYNEEIINRQNPDLKSRIINYGLPEKPMMLSAFSSCAVRNKTDTLYYRNDTIY